MIDLIVCIFIGAFLLALILPAIVKARDQARTQNVSYRIWRTETSIELYKEEVARLEAIKAELLLPGGELREELIARGVLSRELAQIDRNLSSLREEIARLNGDLTWLKKQGMALAPPRR